MWIIEAPITNTAYITFTSVATEDKYDLVDVYVGGNMISNSRYLLSLSGTPAAATIPTIYSNNNFLIVRLTSDEATQYSGFSAQWSTGNCLLDLFTDELNRCEDLLRVSSNS